MKDIDFSRIYSFSKLELFDKCKKQYHFNYLDPEIAPIKKQFLKPRDYNIKGSAVHGAITLFYYLPEKKRTLSNLKKCLEKSWFSEKDVYKKPPLGEIGGFKDIHHERDTYKEALGLLCNFFNLEKQINPTLFYVPVETIKDSFKDYEKMIKPLDGGMSISGKFDRIDKLENGNLRVVDFKTGKNGDNFFQLEFYKLLAEANFGTKVDQVSFYCLAKGKVKNFNVCDVDSKDISNKIVDKIKEIQGTKDFPPQKSYLCNHCDFKEICPAFVKTPPGNYVLDINR